MSRTEIMARWGFAADPFVWFVAEDDERLDRSFVAPPFFDDIISTPERPQPSFVFGARGEGKSALSKVVAQRLRKLDPAPLVVEATDFSGWSVEKIESLTLDDHVRRILNACVEELVERLESESHLPSVDPADQALLEDFVLRFLPSVDYRSRELRLAALLDRLQRHEQRALHRYGGKGWRRVSAYLRSKRLEFENAKLTGDKPSTLLSALILLTPSTPSARNFQGATFQKVFDLFVGLTRRIGLPSVYVLIDKVDEIHAATDRPDLVVKLLSPLAKSVPFLESRGAGIKLFIPLEARKDLVGIRSDRIRTREIRWDDAKLRRFLEARIEAYSNGHHDDLEHVFEDYAAFEPDLLKYSARTPRNMLRILDKVVSEHCQLEDPSSCITPSTARAGLRRFQDERSLEGDSERYNQRIREWEREHPSPRGAP